MWDFCLLSVAHAAGEELVEKINVNVLVDGKTYTSSVDLTTGTSETTTYALPKEGAVDVNSGGQDALDFGKDSTTSSNTKTLNVEVLKDQQQQLTQEEARKKADDLDA